MMNKTEIHKNFIIEHHPSQKKKWKRIQEKTYRPALRVVGAEDVVPDDPFGDMS